MATRLVARSVDTLVILMGLRNLRRSWTDFWKAVASLNVPVALIHAATRPSQKSLLGTVQTIADLAEEAKFRSPTVMSWVKWCDWVQNCTGSARP